MHQLPQLRLDVFCRKSAAEKTYAAVDVETDNASRNNAVCIIHCGNASNWKPVALMNVGHCQSSANDARKSSDIRSLLQGLIPPDHFQESFIGIDHRICAHSGFVGFGNQPPIVVDLLEVHLNIHEDSNFPASSGRMALKLMIRCGLYCCTKLVPSVIEAFACCSSGNFRRSPGIDCEINEDQAVGIEEKKDL